MRLYIFYTIYILTRKHFIKVGLHKFLPRSVLNGMKPKALRKLIQQHFKKVAALSELECMFKFFDLLRAHYRFDQERFICALGVRKFYIKLKKFQEKKKKKKETNSLRSDIKKKCKTKYKIHIYLFVYSQAGPFLLN